MARIYKSYPEFIPRAGNQELYELEAEVQRAINAVARHRVETRGEDFFGEAIPQTLKSMLEHWDKNSATVAARSFLEGGIVEIEVKEK